MVMSNRLLKEYIGLLIENILLEAGTIGTSMAVSTRTTGTTSSTLGTTGTASTEKTKSSGADNKSDTEDSIANIEDMVKSNSEEIEKNKSAINSAAKNMTNYTNNMISATNKTATGLGNAATATKDLNRPENSKEDIRNAIDRQGKAFSDASAGTKQNAGELQKTLTTLQTLGAATKTK
jgi:hypothetical protein